MLTQKQEAFVAKYLECDNASEAYRHAYSPKNPKDETVWNNAYKLLKHNEVAARVDEFKTAIKIKVLDELVIDRMYVTRGITDTIERAVRDDDHSNTLKGLDMLGKMYDLNEDKKNDRMMSNKDKQAILANYKARMIDVTPKGE